MQLFMLCMMDIELYCMSLKHLFLAPYALYYTHPFWDFFTRLVDGYCGFTSWQVPVIVLVGIQGMVSVH